MTDPRGGVTDVSYDASGRVTSLVDPMSRTTSFSYSGDNASGSGGTTLVTDPSGIETLYRYINGEEAQRTVGFGTAEAATWQYGYSSQCLGRTMTIDPDGNVSVALYDASGNLLQTTDPLGRTTSYTYQGTLANLPSSKTDPEGVETTYAYDAAGDVTKIVTNAASKPSTPSQTFLYGYDARGDLTSATDPNGHVTTYGYDAYGDRTSKTDPLGDVTSWTYDAAGDRLSQTSATGGVTRWAYDAAGRVISATDPDANTTRTSYDADGNKISVTDGAGETTSYGYDADNELTTITNPGQTSASFGYNPDGHETSYTDENGHTWRDTYDALGRLASSTDPLGDTTAYGHDPAGETTSVTDALGETTSYAYDAAGELVGITYSSGSPAAVSFAYDADGRRVQMNDDTGQTTDTYDALGRLTSVTDGNGFVVNYAYDPASNVTQMTYDGLTVSYSFDAANRMTSVTDGLGHTTSFTYDDAGNLTAVSYPNGVVAAESYDAAGRPGSITDTLVAQTLAAFSYARNADGLISQATETTPQLPASTPGGPAATAATAYGYSARDQIASANAGVYGYDPAGNLTARPSGQTMSYNAADELQSETTPAAQGGSVPTSFTYDAAGERTAETGADTAILTYDQAGELSSYTASATYGYEYNGDGLRMSKFAGTLAGGVRAGIFIWDTEATTPRILADLAHTFVYGPNGLPVEQMTLTTDEVLYLHEDQLGSVRLATDQSGKVVATVTYSPYGRPAATSGGAVSPLGFAGGYTDAESGFLYLQHRYYDPATAQFLSVDPLVAQTLQPYVYAGNDPVNGNDPSGLCACLAAVPAQAATGLAGGLLATAPAYGAFLTLSDFTAADAGLIAIIGGLGVFPFVLMSLVVIGGAVFLSYLEEQAICHG